MIDLLIPKTTASIFFLLILICSSFSQAQTEENNLNPKISAGIGFQSSPLIGIKSNINIGLSYNLFLTIPLTYSKKINLLYKFIYWEGNSAITKENFQGWGTSISFMYAFIYNPDFRLYSYFGPYSIKSLIPISVVNYNLGIQLEYYLNNNFSLGVDINQLLAFLQENVNPYKGRYYPLIVTFNLFYQF